MDVPGTLVADRYELGELVGAGGAGTVHRGYDRVLDRVVAVKRLRTADDDVRARLRIEARLAGALAHPGIARVYDYGEEDGGRAPYLVMEYVDGPSLRDLVRDGGPLPPERVMSIVAQVADALAVAHAAGVVHRDVKPGNILVRRDGTVVLADFGIARALDLEPLTLTGTIVGTVDYISPEQAAGEGATGRSDLYALGMVAYECLTGVRPLRRDSQVATLLAHLHDDVPPLPPTVPPAVRDVVGRLTAREPRHRPADAGEAARLARAAIDAPTQAPLRLAPAPGAARRRGRRRWLALAPLAAAATVAVAYLAGAGAGPTPPPPASADAATPSVGPSTSAAVTVRATRSAPVTAAPTQASAPAPRRTARPQPRPHRHAAAKKPGAHAHGKAKGHHQHPAKGPKHGRK